MRVEEAEEVVDTAEEVATITATENRRR